MNGNYIVAPNGGVLYLKNGTQALDGIGIFVSNSTGGLGIVDNTQEETRNIMSCTPGELPNFQLGATAQTPNTNDNGNRVATTAFVNNYAPSKSGSGASGTWGINISGNANTATKTTQDSAGQQINTTYVKGITVANATLTVTKGNETNSTVTINNVAHATSSDTATKAIQDGNGNTISSTYLKLSGGQMTGNYIVAPNGGALYLKNGTQALDGIGIFVSNSTGGLGIVDYNRESNQNVFTCIPNTLPNFQLGATAQTPSISDNSTRIATTAFVKSLFTASKATNGWWKDGNTEIIRQWGEATVTNANGVVSFPISFPNACLSVQVTYLNNSTTSRYIYSYEVNNFNKSYFNIRIPLNNPDTGGPLGDTQFLWEAIGY